MSGTALGTGEKMRINRAQSLLPRMHSREKNRHILSISQDGKCLLEAETNWQGEDERRLLTLLGWNQANFTKEVTSKVVLKGFHVAEKAETENYQCFFLRREPSMYKGKLVVLKLLCSDKPLGGVS